MNLSDYEKDHKEQLTNSIEKIESVLVDYQKHVGDLERTCENYEAECKKLINKNNLLNGVISQIKAITHSEIADDDKINSLKRMFASVSL